MVRANTAIADAARKGDVACAQALPKDLGEWRPTIEFLLGPFGCGKDLAEISAVDFARSAERDIDAFCRQGFGALLAKLAAGLPVQLATPVTRSNGAGAPAVEVETRKRPHHRRGRHRHGVDQCARRRQDQVRARSCRSANSMPLRKLKLGSYDHIALELPGNPLGLRTDELVFEKSSGPRTAVDLRQRVGLARCA